MKKVISLDLRERIVAAYDGKEGTREEVAKRFKVSLGLVKKLLAQRARTGDLEPRYRYCGRKARLEPEHGKRSATTAEQLMRARFTAHVAKANEFLHYTYLPSSRQPYEEEPDTAPLPWTRLVIHSHEPEVKPDVSYLDFTAYFNAEGGSEGALHEKSEFHRISGKWIFARTLRQGPAPVKSSDPKVGRNDPCTCGSGKKFKKCCGA